MKFYFTENYINGISQNPNKVKFEDSYLVCMLLKPMPFGKCAISISKRQVRNGQIDCDVFHGQDFYATLYNFFP